MWKLICALLLFQRALSAPSRCAEICDSQNSQYFSNCCPSPLTASPDNNKNWTDHKDFKTPDGAVVHTKDGAFVNGNTRGNFNEMGYYKEFSGAEAQNFAKNFGFNNFGKDHGISQKLEDLSTSSYNSFESMFQSRFSDLFKNFHESFKHLQELKHQNQLPTQDCQYPCLPINEQISRLQQDIAAQQQNMQRMRENFWSQMQNHNTVTETEHVIPNQQIIQSNYQPGHVTKETNRYESYQNEKITTNPHITTTITKKPDKYVSSSDQSQKLNQDYYSGSVSKHESSQQSQNYGSGTYGQHQQNLFPDQSQQPSQDYYSGSVSNHDSRQNYGSTTQGQTSHHQSSIPSESQKTTQEHYSGSYNSQNYGSGTRGQNQNSFPDQKPSQDYYSGSISKHESAQTYGSTTGQSGHNQNSIDNSQNRVSQIQTGHQTSQNYGQGIQSQAGYTQDNTNYEQQNRGSTQRADQQVTPSSQYKQDYGSGTQGNNQQGAYGYHASYGSQSYYSTHPQSGYDHQNSVYKNQQSGSQTQGQNFYGGQAGYASHSAYNSQGSVASSHNSMSHGSLTQNNADFGARENGKLTHGVIQTGSAVDCDESVQPAPYRRYKRHSQNHLHHHYPHHHSYHQQQYPDDFSQEQHPDGILQHIYDSFQPTDQQVKDFGEPTKVVKVSQKELQNLGQHVEDIRHGKVETQDIHQHQDFSQSPVNFDQQNSFDDFSTGNLEFRKQPKHPNLPAQSQDFNTQEHDQYSPYSPPQRAVIEGFDRDLAREQQRQFPSQIKTQAEDQQTQKVEDLPITRGFNQKTVGPLTLDQHARDSFNFNQFPTPVLAPDSKPSAGNQRHDGINPPFNLNPRPAPKPTSRPRNSKPNPFLSNTDRNLSTVKNDDANAEKISNTQKIQNSLEKLNPGGVSAENHRVLTPEDFSLQQINDKFPRGEKSGNESHVMKPGEVLQKHENKSQDDPQQVVIMEQSSKEPKNLFEILSQIHLEPQKNSSQKENSFQTENPLDFSQVLNPPEDFQQHVNPFDDFSQQILQPREKFHQKHENPFEDFSQVLSPPEDFQQHENPFEQISQQVLKPNKNSFQKQENPFQDFSQQISNPHEDFQQHMNPFEDFSQQYSLEKSLQKQKSPFEDFSQQIQNSGENSFSKIERLSLNSSQKIQNPNIENVQKHENFANQVGISRERDPLGKPLDDFSQQIQKSFDDSLLKSQKPFEDLSHQIPTTDEIFSQSPVTPFETFSSQSQITRDDSPQKIEKSSDFQKLENFNKNLGTELEKAFQQVSRDMQELYKDLYPPSDLNGNKDITQLPQSFQDQNIMTHHSNSDIFPQSQDISLGHQWHLSHNPGDLTSENLQLGRIYGPVRKTENFDEIQIQTAKPSETLYDSIFGEQAKEEMGREGKINHRTYGKLEFGQSIQNQRNNPQIHSELPLPSLQPRILQAFGGKGPYDSMHSEDIFTDVRQNPSATLPPVVFDDPWDIREKPIESFDMFDEDKVIPLDTVWVYPDAFPLTPVTEKPNPGFWDRVGRRFSGAVDKARDKARNIFG